MAEIKRYTADFAGQETPVIEVTGDGAGPRLSVIAGVHGCEYASMAGVRRWVSGLAGRALRGTVKVVPVVNLPAFRARSPFVVPEDGVVLFLTSSPAVAADGLLLGLGAA